MTGPVVHGPPVVSRIYSFGQAPGPHEGRLGKPFAWTAGKTLFRWFEEALGVDEETFRTRVYMAAVCRCFPGKDPRSGGDRKPAPEEIAACAGFSEDEVRLLRPRLLLPIGQVAIEQVLGRKAALADVVGRTFQVTFRGVKMDAIPLPHPSGASTWFKMEPGRTLLQKALRRLGRHPEWKAAFSSSRVGRSTRRRSHRANRGSPRMRPPRGTRS